MYNLYIYLYLIVHIPLYTILLFKYILYFNNFPYLIFPTSCILYIWHHCWHMVGSVLTYSGLSALHKKLSQKLVNLASTNAGQVHKKVGNSWFKSSGNAKRHFFQSLFILMLLNWSGIIGHGPCLIVDSEIYMTCKYFLLLILLTIVN